MKRLLFAAALGAAAVPTLAADVGVSISIGEPGFYGRLDIGGYPQPQVIYRRPKAVEWVPAERPPVYLRVPRGHARNWSKHCHKYNACGERVYFVQDNWYTHEYVPRYQTHQRDRRDGHRDDRRDDHRGNDHRGDDRNDHRGDDQGRGRD